MGCGVRFAACEVSAGRERWPWRAAAGVRCADLRCHCVQRDAGYTMNLLQALPGDVVVVLLAATWEAPGP